MFKPPKTHTKPTGFQFQTKAAKKPKDAPLNRVQTLSEQEQFTGQIQGLKASDLEERFGRALDKRNLPYDFRLPFFAPRGAFGEVELDFMIHDGPLSIPVQVDGEFAHASTLQKNHDSQQDAILNDYLAKQGGTLPVKRIGARFLGSQAEADQVVRELI